MNKAVAKGIILVITVILIAACGTSPIANFYTLNAIERSSMAPKNLSRQGSTGVLVGPVTLPESLDQPQIVSRVGSNRLRYDEFNRWGGGFRDDVRRLLGENIGLLLPTEMIVLNHEVSPIKCDYQVIVHIREYTGELGGNVELNADWSVINLENKKTVAARKSVFYKSSQDKTYPAYVTVLSELLADLSREIVFAIKEDQENV